MAKNPAGAFRLPPDQDPACTCWVGLLAPAKTPKPVIDKLNAELNAVLTDPETRAKLDVLGITAMPGPPAKFAEEIKRDLVRYEQVVKAAGIKAGG